MPKPNQYSRLYELPLDDAGLIAELRQFYSAADADFRDCSTLELFCLAAMYTLEGKAWPVLFPDLMEYVTGYAVEEVIEMADQARIKIIEARETRDRPGYLRVVLS